MEGTEKQIFYAKALLDGFEDKVKVRYAKTVIETSQNVVSDQDKTEYIIALNLFFNMFDEKLKDKKYYIEFSIPTIELIKMAVHNKLYDEKKLLKFLQKLYLFTKPYRSEKSVKRFYEMNVFVIYQCLNREDK